MIDTFKIFEELKQVLEPSIAEKIAEVLSGIYQELSNTVTKSEFNELKKIVSELAEAQKSTEKKVSELAEAQKSTEKKVSELAEAQKRTEKKVEELAESQKRLAEAQERTEKRVDGLEKAVKELAEAQKRTEGEIQELKATVSELASAQKRTEKRVDRLEKAVKELAEAQKKTEEEIRKLARDQKSIREELGGLSRTVSYGFENEAFRLLPKFLKEKFGIRIKERLIRADIGGKEVNIFGKGAKDGREVYVVGEVKLRITERKDQERALKDIEEKVKAVISEYGKVDIVKILITHFARKSFLERAEREGIAVIQSFEL